MRALFLVALLASVWAGVAACGDGSGGEDGGATASPTAGDSDPGGSATIENGRFTNPDRGYSVAIPEGWRSDDDWVIAAEIEADGFFGREAGPPPDIQPTIIVQCETSSEPVTTNAYASTRIATVEKLGAFNVSEPFVIKVDGVDAVAYEYDVSRSGGLDFHRVDVMFGRDTCGWLISLSTSVEEAPEYGDLFTDFVNSYRFENGGESASTRS